MKCEYYYNVLLDSVLVLRLWLSDEMVIDSSDSNDANFLEGPLGDRLAQLLVAALLVDLGGWSYRLNNACLEEVVREEVQRADEHHSGVVARLKAGYQQCALAYCMRILKFNLYIISIIATLFLMDFYPSIVLSFVFVILSIDLKTKMT